MADDSWPAARLIPTSGIDDAAEQRRRATSALLAVMSAVREFGQALTQPYGAPPGAVQSYLDVPFTLRDRRYVPDGLLRVTRGHRRWTALVAVKTAGNELSAEQVESYLDIARDQGFDAVLTVSNEIPPVPGQHPTAVDRRRSGRVALHHLPWSEILTQAVRQKERRGPTGPDQAWILGELIRYLEHPASGAMEFTDMGPGWDTVRNAVATGGRLDAGAGVPVVSRFDALIRYACLRLGRRLGAEVTPALSRRDLADPAGRIQALARQLEDTGTLTGALRLPNSVGPLLVTADLRAGTVHCHVDLDAPRSGRSTTRINWLVHQLRNAPVTTSVEAFATHSGGATHPLQAVRADPTVLIRDPSRELRTFRVTLSVPAGTGRGTGPGTFIDSVLAAVDDCHEQVVRDLRPWLPAPLRSRSREEAGAA